MSSWQYDSYDLYDNTHRCRISCNPTMSPCSCPSDKHYPCPPDKPYPCSQDKHYPCPGPGYPNPTAQHLEVYTTGTLTANTLTTTQSTKILSFTTLGEAQGTDIVYSTKTPQSISLNVPGHYLILVKGQINATIAAASTVTVTTSLLQHLSTVDQLTQVFSSTTINQDTFSLQSIVCTTKPSTISVRAEATGLTTTDTVGYSNLNLIIIKLSNQDY